MIPELEQIHDLVLKPNGQEIKNCVSDLECAEYFGVNFQINDLNIKFRKAKTTPKKIGFFVTLWKRNPAKQTEPFHVNDDFDFYIIATAHEQNFGFFLFPKQILSEQQVLTNSNKEGKRGFRVYPDWTIPENKQAEKTKSWQTNYFLNLTDSNTVFLQKFNTIMVK